MRARIPARIIATVARLGRIAAASAGPQAAYRWPAWNDLSLMAQVSSHSGCFSTSAQNAVHLRRC